MCFINEYVHMYLLLVAVCSELTEVKGHDREVTMQANQALDDVCTMLTAIVRRPLRILQTHSQHNK